MHVLHYVDVHDSRRYLSRELEALLEGVLGREELDLPRLIGRWPGGPDEIEKRCWTRHVVRDDHRPRNLVDEGECAAGWLMEVYFSSKGSPEERIGSAEQFCQDGHFGLDLSQLIPSKGHLVRLELHDDGLLVHGGEHAQQCPSGAQDDLLLRFAQPIAHSTLTSRMETWDGVSFVTKW